jgi:hypothetical protein
MDTRKGGNMTRNDAVREFESTIAPGLCDYSPATLRTAWNDYTDALSKSGTPAAYNWSYPRWVRIAGRTYRTEAR